MLSNIDNELQTIQNGRYGEDVRGAIHDAIEKVNEASINKEAVGLSNVDNTSDMDKPVSTAVQEALDGQHETMTLAEYEALSEDEKTDGTVRFITDSDGMADAYSRSEVDALVNGKQDKLTFDERPVYASGNPVTSGGVYRALSGIVPLSSGGLGVDFSAAGTKAGFHNSIFRGKYLGNALTDAQSEQIKAGAFDDLFVGDYWRINGVNWRIADFDTYYNCGNSDPTPHHIAIVPDESLYLTSWNETDETSGGYSNSAVRASIKASGGAEETVITAFGDSHVLSYRTWYPSTYTNGAATGAAWVDARVELMNEMEVYGTPVWSTGGRGYEVGIAKRQLSLFRLSQEFINIRVAWWLRGVMNEERACLVNSLGNVSNVNASRSYNVRPFALIA